MDQRWQPIETAPRDGSEFDIRVESAGGVARIPDVSYRRFMGPQRVLAGRQNIVSPHFKVTHWMPAPDLGPSVLVDRDGTLPDG